MMQFVELLDRRCLELIIFEKSDIKLKSIMSGINNRSQKFALAPYMNNRRLIDRSNSKLKRISLERNQVILKRPYIKVNKPTARSDSQAKIKSDLKQKDQLLENNFKSYQESFEIPFQHSHQTIENVQSTEELIKAEENSQQKHAKQVRKNRLRTLDSRQNEYQSLSKDNRNSLYSINSMEKSQQGKEEYDIRKIKSPYFYRNRNSLAASSNQHQVEKNELVQRKNRYFEEDANMKHDSYHKRRPAVHNISLSAAKSGDLNANRRIIKSNSSNYNSIKNRSSNSRSFTSVIDSNLDQLIKKEFSSIDHSRDTFHKNPMDPSYLTDFEREEIKNYKEIFYIGHKAALRKYKQGYRDSKENYKPIIGDHIAYRFQILKVLGSGAFGKVLEVADHKQPEAKRKKYALKILKKSSDLYEQFKLQIKILKLSKKNPEALKNIVQIKGDFQFRGHICIVTELLDLNVYSYIKSQQFEGLSLDIVRKILIQILQALYFLHHKSIIHCDIKPQNIVFKESGKSGVKLIDFGSACFMEHKQFTYIQSRYYRSPEIVLVKPYDEKIDAWSVGCLAYEMFTGSPLFPARCEGEQIAMLKETLGSPPKEFLSKCEREDEFSFPENHSPMFPLSKRINAQTSSHAFIKFMEDMIKWSPEQRITITEALSHDFILEGLPPKVKEQHLKQMRSCSPYGLNE